MAQLSKKKIKEYGTDFAENYALCLNIPDNAQYFVN